MSPRFLTMALVLFWLGSVVWLCAVVWAPPESRMARVDPLEVYRVFFGWNDSANMTLLENGVRRGQITVAGGSGEDAETGALSRVLSVSGTMESFDESSASTLAGLFWKGSLEFSEEMEVRDGEFSVRVPRQELTVHLSFSENEAGFRAKVVMGGQEMLNFDSGASGAEGIAGALPLLLPGAAGWIGPVIGGGTGGGLPDPALMKFETEARMGNFTFGGREMRAFLLRLRSVSQDQELRIFLSEAGEPLKIESDLGYEAMSEILVPLDAYRPGFPERKND